MNLVNLFCAGDDKVVENRTNYHAEVPLTIEPLTRSGHVFSTFHGIKILKCQKKKKKVLGYIYECDFFFS